jgi:transcriptional regulator GlxA family with amidase domain
MYLKSFEPARPVARTPVDGQRSQFSDFVFVSQDASVAFLAEACIDVLDSANRLTGREGYSWTHMLAEEALEHSDKGLCGPDQNLVLIGGASNPWRPDGKALSMLRNGIRNTAHLCVVGSAVFVPLAAGVLAAKQLAIHTNFRSGVREDPGHPEIAAGSVCHNKTLSSATGHVAAIRMMLDLVGSRDGEFTRISLARDLGLMEPQEDLESAEHWRLKRLAQGDPVICDALKMMDDHLEDTLSVGQIAELLDVSPRKLERGFREQLGRTPLKIYRDLRLERAHKLLAQTSMSVSEVSVACGFSNVTLMKKWFAQKYGQEPQDVRREAFAGVRSIAAV